MSVIEEMAGHLAGLDAGNKDILELHLVDTIGAAILGPCIPEGRALLDGEGDGLTALSAGNALDQVAVRVGMTRLSELDDIHLSSGTTPGSIIVPAVTTLSAHLPDVKAEDFGAAMVAGLEAMIRLGAGVRGPEIIYRGIWTTYFTAPFGSAAACARLLGLDANETAHALAIALTSIAGRMGQPGSEKTARWLMAGHAARAGCFAALSARDGFRGDLSLLDGAWLENAHGVASDAERFNQGWGGESALEGISLKPFCSAKQIIAAVTAFKEILAGGLDPDSITSLTIHVPQAYAKMIDHGVVAGNRLSSISSGPYQLAVAAYHPEALYDAVRGGLPLDDKVAELMEKTSVAVDADLAAHMPGCWPGRVEVTGPAGTEEATITHAPSDPGNQLSPEEALEKLHKAGDRLIGAEAVEDWISLARGALSDDGAVRELAGRFVVWRG
ncbi:MAG: MmgE/PrpD family protein [Rhodospirillales bacterium]|nr:MmgE/PrpD family protein [Rhodospirillales bacterium]